MSNSPSVITHLPANIQFLSLSRPCILQGVCHRCELESGMTGRPHFSEERFWLLQTSSVHCTGIDYFDGMYVRNALQYFMGQTIEMVRTGFHKEAVLRKHSMDLEEIMYLQQRCDYIDMSNVTCKCCLVRREPIYPHKNHPKPVNESRCMLRCAYHACYCRHQCSVCDHHTFGLSWRYHKHNDNWLFKELLPLMLRAVQWTVIHSSQQRDMFS